MFRKRIIFILIIPILLAFSIHAIPQSEANNDPTAAASTNNTSPDTAANNTAPSSPNNTADSNQTPSSPNNTAGSNQPDSSPNATSSNQPASSNNTPDANKPSTDSNQPAQPSNSSSTAPKDPETPANKSNDTASKPEDTKKPESPTNQEESTPRPQNALIGFECPKRNRFYPYPGKCDVYIQCKDYIPLTYICPDGLQFNRRARKPELVCDVPSVAKCRKESEERDKDSEENNKNGYNRKSSEIVVLKVPTTENKEKLQPTLFVVKGRQDKDNKPNRPELPECKKRNGVYRYPKKCDAYVLCKNFKPRAYKCPEGLHFNLRGQSPNYCDEPEVAKCKYNDDDEDNDEDDDDDDDDDLSTETNDDGVDDVDDDDDDDDFDDDE